MEYDTIKVASEKWFNRNIFPVKSIKGKQLSEEPFLNDKNNPKFECIGGSFDEKEMMLMDVFATCLIHDTYNRRDYQEPDFSKMIPKMYNPKVQKISGMFISKAMLDVFKKFYHNYETDIIPYGFFDSNCNFFNSKKEMGKRFKIPRSLNFSDVFLKSKFPFLKKFSSKQIRDLIQNASSCRFKMIYPIRYHTGKEYKNFEFNNFNYSSRLFRVVACEPLKISKNDKILQRRYEIRFDTILGYFFAQNVLSCYIDLLPAHFYEMSPYTQLLYRLLIRPYYKKAKNPMSLEDIKARLILKSENYMCRKTIEKILNKLESNHFISKVDGDKNFEFYEEKIYKYRYVRNEWKTIIQHN